MESRELLCRIKAGDDEAFRTMVLTYGKPVYLRLLERSGNKEVAKEALREAFIDLYITVKMANSKDPVEALLQQGGGDTGGYAAPILRKTVLHCHECKRPRAA